MLRRAIWTAVLLTAGPFAAQAAVSSPNVPHAALLIVTPDRAGQDFERPATAESPTFDGRQFGYAGHASGLDRIDPADFKVFGAEIGGNGVQGGAVVSLSWPTER
jgi:hypothetical protein